MKENLTKKDLILLGKDLMNAKIAVLYKHNFSCSEISEITGVKESVIRKLLYQIAVNSKEDHGRYPWGE